MDQHVLIPLNVFRTQCMPLIQTQFTIFISYIILYIYIFVQRRCSNMIKKIISCAVVMFIFALSCTNSFAVTDSASKSYSGYGTLKGTIEMEKASNSKSVYLVTTIGKKCNYVGWKLSIKNATSGETYLSTVTRSSSNTTKHSEGMIFQKGYNSTHTKIFNNKCVAYGTHEFRHTTSGVVYTKVVL